jgi:ankyrin repeat protein
MSLIENIRIAIETNNHQRLVTLLERCAQTNCNINQLTRGSGLIHVSINVLNLPFLQLLIEYGANPNLLDSNGITPLELAVQQGNIDMIEYLLDNGAQIPNNILTLAIESFVEPEIIEYLLNEGAISEYARELVDDILLHEGEDDYEFNGIYLEDDDYQRFRDIKEVFDNADH